MMMKYYSVSLLLLAAARLAAAELVLDFESGRPAEIASGFAVVSSRNPLAGGHSLQVENTDAKRPYTEVVTLRPGALQPNEVYEVSFRYRVDGRKDGKTHFQYFLRSASAAGKDLHTMQFAAPKNDGKTGEISFTAEIGDVPDYALSIGMFQRGAITIDDIRLRPTRRKTLPVTTDTASAAMKQPEISGCPEFTVLLPEPGTRPELSAADFGLSEKNADNTAALQSALRRAAETGAGKLIIPTGRYRFKNPRAVEFSKLNNLLIDGMNSEFILADATPGEFLWFRNCEKVELRNLSLDWDWEALPLASEVRVAGIAPDASYADVRFVDYDTVPVTPERLEAVNAVRRTDGTTAFSLWDNLDSDRTRVHFTPARVEFPGGAIARIHAANNREQLRREFFPGRRFRLRHFFQSRKAVKVDDSRHLTFRNLTIYSMPGGGFVFKRATQYIQLLECGILNRPGRKPLITTAGDLFHQIYTQGYFKLDGCRFENGGDDMMNLKGCNAFGAEKTADDQMLAFNVAEWQMQFDPGDTVKLYTSDFRSYWSGKIKSATFDRKRNAFQLTFDRKLPETLDAWTLTVNETYNSGHFIVRNCVFSDGEAQGLLIQVPHGLVENCLFRNLKGPALQFSFGFGYTWSEGDRIDNIVVRNNRILNCNLENKTKFGDSEQIYLGPYSLFGGTAAEPVVQNILFENNRFEDTTGLAFSIRSARNVVIRDNFFGRTVPDGANTGKNAILLDDTTGVFLRGNHWSSGRAELLLSGDNPEIFQGNNTRD